MDLPAIRTSLRRCVCWWLLMLRARMRAPLDPRTLRVANSLWGRFPLVDDRRMSVKKVHLSLQAFALQKKEKKRRKESFTCANKRVEFIPMSVCVYVYPSAKGPTIDLLFHAKSILAQMVRHRLSRLFRIVYSLTTCSSSC